MILTDKEITKLVETHNLIEPFLPKQKQAGMISYGLDGSGYDIRLASEYKLLDMDRMQRSKIPLDPKNQVLNQFWIDKKASGGRIVVPARGLIQVAAIEKFNLPSNVQAFSHDGKSTYARLGIVPNITPIDAGYSGSLTFSISNPFDVDMVLYAGEGITQIVFHYTTDEVGTDYGAKGGKYQGSEGVTSSKIKENE